MNDCRSTPTSPCMGWALCWCSCRARSSASMLAWRDSPVAYASTMDSDADMPPGAHMVHGHVTVVNKRSQCWPWPSRAVHIHPSLVGNCRSERSVCSVSCQLFYSQCECTQRKAQKAPTHFHTPTHVTDATASAPHPASLSHAAEHGMHVFYPQDRPELAQTDSTE